VDQLGALPYVQGGALVLLLAFLAWMLRAIARGDWVPRRELDYVRTDRDARVAEKDREIEAWKAVGATERTRGDIANQQLGTALAGFATLDRFFDALREVAERNQHVPPPPS
jgi:hypothetical protein